MVGTTVFKILRGMAGLESGRWCRGCSEAIVRGDDFGMSEGVCRPCRTGTGLVAVRYAPT